VPWTVPGARVAAIWSLAKRGGPRLDRPRVCCCREKGERGRVRNEAAEGRQQTAVPFLGASPLGSGEMPDKAVLSTGYGSFPNGKAHNDEVHAPFVFTLRWAGFLEEYRGEYCCSCPCATECYEGNKMVKLTMIP
jgi:hypothetical protein